MTITKGRKVLIRAVMVAAFSAAGVFVPVPGTTATVMTMTAMAAEGEMQAEVINITEVASQDGEAVLDDGVSGGSRETEEKKLQAKEAEKQVAQTAGVRTYTEEDLYILAHVICGEAQGYSDEEQRYVGSVVLNRVNHPGYPNSIKEVVFQRGQYACTWDGNYYREPTAANWANARWLLENGSLLPGNVVYQSGGKQGSGVYLRTSRHYYCYI